jgi:hypothetical protein
LEIQGHNPELPSGISLCHGNSVLSGPNWKLFHDVLTTPPEPNSAGAQFGPGQSGRQVQEDDQMSQTDAGCFMDGAVRECNLQRQATKNSCNAPSESPY